MDDSTFIAWLYRNKISLPRLSKKQLRFIYFSLWILAFGLLILAAIIHPFQELAATILLVATLIVLLVQVAFVAFFFRCPYCYRTILNIVHFDSTHNTRYCPHCGKALEE